MSDPVALIDTTVLISPPAVVAQNLRRFVSSTICRAELTLGIEVARSRESEAEMRRRITRLVAYDRADIWMQFDSLAADKFGGIAAPFALKVLESPAGQNLPKIHHRKDALIAAHAQALGIPVLTDNADDFRRLGVPVVTPDGVDRLLS